MAELIGIAALAREIKISKTPTILTDKSGYIILKRATNEWISLFVANKTSVSFVNSTNSSLFLFGEDKTGYFNVYKENGVVYIKYNSDITETFTVLVI